MEIRQLEYFREDRDDGEYQRGGPGGLTCHSRP